MTSVETYPSAVAKARFVRVSPTKARRVIDLVRGKSVTDALDILRWAPQDASEPVAKVIASAAANAQNNEGLDPSTLVVATIYADEGPTAKRIRPRAQGRAFRIRKRTSHITVIVESRPSQGRAGRRPVRQRRARTSRAGQQGRRGQEGAGDQGGRRDHGCRKRLPAKKAPAKKAPEKAAAKKAPAKKAAAKKTAEASDEAKEGSE